VGAKVSQLAAGRLLRGVLWKGWRSGGGCVCGGLSAICVTYAGMVAAARMNCVWEMGDGPIPR